MSSTMKWGNKTQIGSKYRMHRMQGEKKVIELTYFLVRRMPVSILLLSIKTTLHIFLFFIDIHDEHALILLANTINYGNILCLKNVSFARDNVRGHCY